MSGSYDPAFPVPMIPCDREGGYTNVENEGMTLRDYRATHILSGMMMNPGIVGQCSEAALCLRAYILADELAKAAEVPTR